MRGCGPEPKLVEVPIKIEVPVPVIVKEFDTVREPYPVYIEGPTVVDSLYYNKYMQLTTDLQRDSLFKDAITIREYKERIEDDTITITLNMRVQGFLKEYQVGYETKPYSIPLDTVIKVAIPKKVQLFGGLELGLPLSKIGEQLPVVKGNLLMKNKKDNLYTIGIDTEKRIWLGMLFKF